jgi:hypothetical protein
MKEGGWTLALIGVIVAIIGTMIDVSVTVPYAPDLSQPYGSYLPRPATEVANLHKMHIQALVIQTGFALFIGGIVLGAAGAVRDALLEGRNPAAEERSASAKAEPQPGPAREPASIYQPGAGTSDEPDGVLKWIVGIAVVVFLTVVVIALIASSRQTSAPAAGGNLLVETQNVLDRPGSAMDEINAAAADAQNDLDAASNELNAAAADTYPRALQ